LLVQEKVTKEKDTPGAADFLLRFSPERALANSSAAYNAARLEQRLA